MRQQNNQNPNLPITPNEISEAVVIFHEILLLKDLYLPRDKLLLKAARMTLPILELAITFFQIMDRNRTCFSSYHSRYPVIVENHDSHNYYPTHTEEFFLHRFDMSIYVEEHHLNLDFGNLEGSVCKEINEYSHRFDEYLPYVERIKVGYDALSEIIDPLSPKQPIKFELKKERDWALQYVQCCKDMEVIILQLVDGFQLNFTDALNLPNSSLGREIFQESGTVGLQLKLRSLKEHLDEEIDVAHSF